MSDHAQLRLVRTTTAPAAATDDGAAVAALARAAAGGDEHAWQRLVEDFSPALRAAARSFRLAPADVDDVVQATWLAALCHIRRLQKPEAIGAWLLTTARREALRSRQRRLRETVTDSPPEQAAPRSDQPDALLLAREREQALQTAVHRLPARQRHLLHALLTANRTRYADLSTDLEMPIGAIGPTRDRGLARLRRDSALTSLLQSDAA